MEDREPRMRIQAIRASETLYKAGDKSFAADYRRFLQDPSVDVVIQAMLTMNKWKVPDAAATIKATADANKARGVQLVADDDPQPGGGRGPGRARRAGRRTGLLARGARPHRQGRADLQRAVLLLPRHGRLRRAEAGARSARWRRRWPDRRASTATATTSIKAVLFGLTGPVDDRT